MNKTPEFKTSKETVLKVIAEKFSSVALQRLFVKIVRKFDMRALLGINIVIHREASTVVNQNIGTLLRWLEKVKYEKCVHLITVNELKNYKDKKRMFFGCVIHQVVGVNLGLRVIHEEFL